MPDLMREPSKRLWIKLFIKECLIGTIREDLTPSERGLWYDFLILAGYSRVPGVICANENTPIPHKRIAAILNVPLPLVNQCLKKFKQSGRIKIDTHGLIHILNWEKYQYSDYDRQKIYREKAKADRTITTYTPEMFEEDDAYIEELLEGMDKGKEKTLIYTASVFRGKYGQAKAAEYWPQYLIYLEQA